MEQDLNIYIITYSNSFYFEGVLLAFCIKELFNISSTIPSFIAYNEKCNCWNEYQPRILKKRSYA